VKASTRCPSCCCCCYCCYFLRLVAFLGRIWRLCVAQSTIDDMVADKDWKSAFIYQDNERFLFTLVSNGKLFGTCPTLSDLLRTSLFPLTLPRCKQGFPIKHVASGQLSLDNCLTSAACRDCLCFSINWETIASTVSVVCEHIS
jgi:hypothetical protein